MKPFSFNPRKVCPGCLTRLLLLLTGLLLGNVPAARAAEALANLDDYNVVWTSPSESAAGAMPIGNGEVGLNVWVEPDGDLRFYVARTDAWSECCRLLKLGRVRVHLTPSPFTPGQSFRQELKLRDGQIVIQAGDVSLRVFVDANAPVVYVTGNGDTPRTITATWETWRTDKHVLVGEELNSSWTMLNAPTNMTVWESPDGVTNSPADTVLAWHRNAYSVVPLTLEHQGLETLAGLVHDPLENRTFGARMSGRSFKATAPNTLATPRAVKSFALAIATQSAQTPTLAAWERQLPQPVKPATALRRTTEWWHQFWDRSWIFVQADSPAATNEPAFSAGTQITRAYVLQRWMTACAGRGNYPIKFNGSIFTVDPKFAGGPDYSPDWRRWGDSFWWQNTRIPYFPMIARGDFDELRPLFWMYREAVPLSEARAKAYYGASGVYFPETMTIFGTYANGDYGWDRTGHVPSEILSPWWQYAWQQGLELTALMLDYYEYTGDKKFLTNDLVPMANAVLRYYDTRFHQDAVGKLVLTPTQAVETYWDHVTNDTPSVAGLTDVCARLLRLPAAPADREFWQRMQAATPPLPVRDDHIRPAAEFDPHRSNVENPEFYALWPFRLYGVGRPNVNVAVNTFRDRIEKASVGWQYDGQCAAIAGMADTAGELLLAKAGNSHPHFRFPAMWGPNYDWLPDQDHGNNLMLTLQNMVLQADGNQIYLLPAWPEKWNVSFKLHAPQNTVIEGSYRDGKLTELKVSPKSRRKDVHIMTTETAGQK